MTSFNASFGTLGTGSETNSVNWRKSARCAGNGACVEIASLTGTSGLVGARDAKHGERSPIVTFSRGEWRTFVERTKKGEFDLHP